MNLDSLGLLGLFIGTFLSATVIPFSSDALFIAALKTLGSPASCILVGTAGNWLGSVVTYYMGRLGKWEWIEKYFRVKPEKLENSKRLVDRYGVWLALICWVPFVGDIFALALGFFKADPIGTIVLLLIGKAGRFICWAALL